MDKAGRDGYKLKYNIIYTKKDIPSLHSVLHPKGVEQKPSHSKALPGQLVIFNNKILH